jgi:hypothetical protein
VDVKTGKWTRPGNLGEPGTECFTTNCPVWGEGELPQGVRSEGDGYNPSRCKTLDPTERVNGTAWEPSLETPLRAQEEEELDLERLFAETLIPRGIEAKSPKISLGRGGRPWVEDSESNWTGDRLRSGALCVREGARTDGWSSKSPPPDRRVKECFFDLAIERAVADAEVKKRNGTQGENQNVVQHTGTFFFITGSVSLYTTESSHQLFLFFFWSNVRIV